MSEDKRKSARTQGRYSDGDKEYCSRRQDKTSSKMHSTDKNKGEKRKAPVVGSRAQNEIDLQFDEESKYSFKELEPVKKPQELRFAKPELELSETNNGVSRLMYEPGFMNLSEADKYFKVLGDSTEWYDKNIVIRGVEYPQPRLVAWYGPHPYTYAGATLEAREMPNAVREIKEKVEESLKRYHIKVELNSVLLNWYRNEKDSVAWHSDDELALGICPTIASVSLGDTRKFEMRPKEHVKDYDAGDIVYVNLTHGSLIVMDGCMQQDWLHRVPKEYHDRGGRINLTFRTIYPLDQLPPEMPHLSKMKSSKSPSGKVMHQQDPKFDTESFPPLGMEVNDKKTKIFPKENVNEDHQLSSNQRKSPKEHWGTSDKKQKYLSKGNNKSYQQSVIQRKSQRKENWDDEMHQGVEDTSTIQNNLIEKSSPDPMIHSPESSPSQLDYNSNIDKSAKFCDKQFLTSSDRYQSHDCEPADSHFLEYEDSSPSKTKPVEIKEEPIEIDVKMSDSGKKYRLNADAPDFIPQNKFENFSLSELAAISSQLKEEELQSFQEVMSKRMDANQSLFLNRDFYELDIYYKLMEDDSLSAKHLKIILERIGSMIKNALYKQNDPRYMNRYQTRSFDENNHHKHKQSYTRSQKY